MGIKSSNLSIVSFNVRRFSYYRKDILDRITKLRPSINLDVVFVPSSDDVHHDHRLMHKEAIRAFKTRTILGYKLIWNELVTTLTCRLH